MTGKCIIPVGYFGGIDVTPYESIVDHPLLQRHGNIKQLSFSYYVYRGANHTRLEHMAATFYLAQKSVVALGKGVIDDEWIEPLHVYSLIHDIGHLPFSHVMEFTFQSKLDIDQNGVDMLDFPNPSGGKTLREVIQDIGVDDEKVEALLSHKKPEFSKRFPLHQIVSDRNLGVDKLSYVAMDAHYTGFQERIPDVESILSHLRFDGKKLGLFEEGEGIAMDIMELYVDLRLNVYTHHRSRTIGRMMQKATEFAHSSGELDIDEVILMDDIDLTSFLRRSKNSDARELAVRIKHRDIPYISAIFNPHDSKRQYSRFDAAHVRVSEEFLDQYYKAYFDPHHLTRIESRIEDELQLPRLSIFFPYTPNLNKIYPRDTPLFDSNGNPAGSILGKNPEFERSLKQKIDAELAVLLTARQPYHKKVSDNAGLVLEIIEDDIQKYS